MEPTPTLTEPRTHDAEEEVSHFTGTLGSDLRAIRARRRRTILELLAIAGGALLLGILCALFLAK